MAGLERVFNTSFIIFYLLGISFSIEDDTNVPLLYTTAYDVAVLDTETGVTTNISEGNNLSARYIDYHYTTGYVYWSNTKAMTISRKKYPLDGSDAEVIFADAKFTGIAIDTESDHLYLLDYSDNGALLRSDLKGTNRVEILTGLFLPAAIALDTVNKWVYYSAVSTNKTRITKCKFDGSNQQSIITDDNPGQIFGISLDLIEQRIYWTDFVNHSIKSAKVDGSDIQLITSGILGPLGIDLHNNDIYFTDYSGKLYKQSKSPGSSKILIHNDTQLIFDVKVCQKYINNWTFVVIGVALGVVAAILLVIGLIYVRNKNSTKEQIFVKFDNEKDTTSRDHEIT